MTPTPMKKCNHKNLKCCSRCGDELGFRCPNCNVEFKRKSTKEEKALIKKEDKEHLGIHKISHEFQRKFYKSHDTSGRSFKWKGYDLMERVRKWAKKYPSVIITRCDDNHFCGSDLVFIPHENVYSYMGASLIIIPQCTGEEAMQVFLYPPDLYEKNGEYFCNTYDEPMIDDDGDIIQYGCYPKNCDKMSRGALLKKDLDTKSTINFTI
jgi:hypothetical protein